MRVSQVSFDVLVILLVTLKQKDKIRQNFKSCVIIHNCIFIYVSNKSENINLKKDQKVLLKFIQGNY